MLGLLTSEQLEPHWSLNARRKIFHRYPNGRSPLMGLLSLMDNNHSSDEGTSVDKPEFGWHEDRGETFEYKTASSNAAGCFTDLTGNNGDGGVDLASGGWSADIGDKIRVKLAPYETIQPKDVVQLMSVPTTGSDIVIQGIVDSIYPTTGHIDLEMTAPVANVLNTGATVDLAVVTVGSANAEGGYSGTGFMTYPEDVSNFTQIFKNAFEFSRTALKAGAKWDRTGAYKEKAKKNSLKHMASMEYAAMFSQRSKSTIVDPNDGSKKTRRTMGGILWYLQQWEKANSEGANTGAFDYRPNGSDVSNEDWRDADDKRIINVNGTATKREMDMLLERAFRYTNEETFEKLMLCGSGMISVLNRYVDGESVKQTTLNSKEDSYGMNVTTWVTPHGTVHFKDHPLMSQTQVFRNSGFILDVGNLRYKCLSDSDTELLKNQHPRGFDGRKDEWLTECGIEVDFPETHMFIGNLLDIQ